MKILIFNRIIIFNKIVELELKYLFEQVNKKYEEKHFNELKIRNDFIEEIEDVLSQISIDKIEILDCQNLKQIL